MRTSVGRPRWMSPSTPSTACWSSDARATSAPPDPRRGWGQCARTPVRAPRCHASPGSPVRTGEREPPLGCRSGATSSRRPDPARRPRSSRSGPRPPGWRWSGRRGPDRDGPEDFARPVVLLAHAGPTAPSPRFAGRRRHRAAGPRRPVRACRRAGPGLYRDSYLAPDLPAARTVGGGRPTPADREAAGAGGGSCTGTDRPARARRRRSEPRMPGSWRKPPFDSDTLSSIWVMACRDESPVVTAFSIAFRLGGGITPDQVMELVKGRRELFRLGLTPAQSRAWKERYRRFADGGPEPPPKPQPKAEKPDQKDKGQEGDKEEEKRDGGKDERKEGQGKGKEGQDEGKEGEEE